MRAASNSGRYGLWLAVLVTLFPLGHSQAAEAPAATAAARAILDRALDSHGDLHGRVVNPQGIPRAGHTVVAQAVGYTPITTMTDAEGTFVLSGLRGGVYTIGVEDELNVYRVWTQAAAPPSAREGLLIVTGDNVARGKIEVTPYTATITAVAVGAGVLIYNAMSDSDDAS